MTVPVKSANGETLFEINMGTFVTIMLALMSAIFFWLFYLHGTAGDNKQKIAVVTQEAARLKEHLDSMNSDIKEMKPILYEIRQDQVRRFNKEGK